MRAEAETFIQLLEHRRRGQLLLCLGPPAERERRLAQAAQYLSRRGLEVVLGFWDPVDDVDGRLVEGLEALPRQRLEYRGLAMEEMDLAAVLKRRPQVAVVQDLAHANVPGGNHASRYQDVREMLAAGISVLGSADPWHLEGLPGLNSPGAPSPRGRSLPASFWRRADQIVLLEDAAGEAEAPPGRSPLPSEVQVFLRELASPKNGPPAPPAACQRLMVCLPGRGGDALALLRGVQGMDVRNGGSWFAVHVGPHDTSPRDDLEQACQEARRQGAEVVLLEGKDPLAPLLDFARAHGVRHIVLGRPRRSSLGGLLKRSLGLRLLRHGSDFDLHIMDLAEPRV
jgi:two-component system sensor histidine kinase KdpD